MKSIWVALLVFSGSLAFANSYVCQGSNEGERLSLRVLSKSETAEITNASGGKFVAAVEISNVSSDLSDGFVSEDSTSYDVLAEKGELEKAKVHLTNWDGNWGYELDMPRETLINEEAVQTFEMTYKFIYNDIAEFELTRTLTCTLN